MIIGMSTSAFTLLHVLISLIAIATGILVAVGLLGGKTLPATTAVFLITTLATSVTGFMFPTPVDAPHIIGALDPAKMIGLLSLVSLVLALVGRYIYGLAGAWRGTYVVSGMIALYFNCFVLVVQLFQKVPLLHALAPTQKDPPFGVAQGILLALFVGLVFGAFKRFHPVDDPSSLSHGT